MEQLLKAAGYDALTNWFSNDEFKNKLFVAITRAKNNVYILCENNNEISEFINNLLK